MYVFTDAAWWLGWAAEGLVKSTLILTAAWMVTAWLLRSSSASLRHWIWITALGSLLVMPVLAPLLPAWEVPWLRVPLVQPASGADVQTRVYETSRVAVPSEEAARADAGPAYPSAPAVVPAARDEALPLAGGLVLSWLAGAVVFVLRPGLGVAYVARLTRRARRNGGTVNGGAVMRVIRAEGLMRRVTVVRSACVAIPVTWGIWRPVILLPMESRTWSDAQVRSVLLHELAHIRRWDYPLYLLAQVARAWYWFNPLAWVAVRRVQAEQEQACDDRVLQAGMPSSDYATHLLAVARAYRPQRMVVGGSVGMAHHSALKGRIRAILSPQTNRRPLSLPAGAYATALMGLLVVPIAMVPGPNAARTPVPQLVRTLEQGDVAARQQAALRLGRIKDARAVEALIAALDDTAEPVSVSARLALRRLDTPRARQALARHPAVPPPAVEPSGSEAPDEDGPAYVWLEAEQGILDDPMQLLGTVEASGGSYVKVPQNWARDEADQDDEHLKLRKHGAVTFVFTIEQAGEYAIWGRTLAPATDKNSFFVSVDGAPDVIWDTPDELATASRWVWDRVSARGQEEQPGVDPMIVHLEPGQHTLQVRNRENGTKLDRLLVTNDLDYQPTGHGALPAPTHYRSLWIEAEDGSLSEPLRVLDDESAVNGQYLEVDDGHNSTEQPPEHGRGLYRFTILEAGTYVLWGRLIAPDDTGDSFWVRVDGDQWVPWNGIWQEEEWHWVPVYHKEDVTQPMQFSLSAGAHTVEIAYREDGTKLDRLLITNDLAYEPEGTGEAAKPVEVIFRTD